MSQHIEPDRCDSILLPGVGLWDGYVVNEIDGWVSFGYPGFLSQEDQTNASSKTKVTQSVVYVVITCFVEIEINTNKVET